LLGLYPPGFACFYGKNVFGWKDQQDHRVDTNIRIDVVRFGDEKAIDVTPRPEIEDNGESTD
jgi:hypothetical protein